MANDLLAKANDLLAMANDLLAMANDPLAMANDLFAVANDLFAVAEKRFFKDFSLKSRFFEGKKEAIGRYDTGSNFVMIMIEF